MALVVHELVTNSTKYGSLSSRGRADPYPGTATTAGDLVLDWRETGGPPVKPPTRKGFGTTIIERSVPYDLGGRARRSTTSRRASIARFRIPARHVSEPKTLSPDRASSIPARALGHPPRRPTACSPASDVASGRGQPDHRARCRRHPDRLGAESVTTAATVEAALDAIDAQPDGRASSTSISATATASRSPIGCWS